MSKSLIKEFYREIHLDDLTISYSGSFTDSMTEKIIELSEAYLDSNKKLSKLKRRTSFLVAECFQNVVRHSPKETGTGVEAAIKESFFLRFYENKCFIASENSIPNSQVESLKSKLDLVNKYEQDQLREFYRVILDEGQFSDEGGAGLGLIEMARKTGNKLSYSFDPLDEKVSKFYLMLVLENAAEEGPLSDNSEELKVIKRIIRHVQEDNMFLLYKGNFDSEIIEHIEKIIENSLDARHDSLATKIKLYHAAIMNMYIIGQYRYDEQNVNTGMLFLGRSDSGYAISATFPVSEEVKIRINNLLSEIRNIDREKLDHRHQEILKLSAKGEVSDEGMSFYQLALISKSWDYEFDSPRGLPEELVFQVNI